MRNLIAATAMAALLATQASATTYYEPEPKPPVEQPQKSSSDGVDLLPILLGVILVGIAASSRRAEPDLSEPRPQVRPQTCLNKHGVIVACDR